MASEVLCKISYACGKYYTKIKLQVHPCLWNNKLCNYKDKTREDTRIVMCKTVHVPKLLCGNNSWAITKSDMEVKFRSLLMGCTKGGRLRNADRGSNYKFVVYKTASLASAHSAKVIGNRTASNTTPSVGQRE